jgi:hypothetical protein
MKKRLAIFGSIAILLTAALAAGGIWWWQTHRNPFPADIRQNTVTPLYFPTKVPTGFKLNPDSFSQKRGVVLYNFDTPDGDKLHITIEKKPAKYDLNQLYNSTLQDTKTVAVPLGTAHIGTLGLNTMANLVVGDTWIMAVYSQPGATDDLTNIMKSLKRY